MPVARLSLRHYGPQAAGHAHEHAQVLWPCRGALSLRIDRAELALSPGTACVIPPHAWHDYAAPHGSVCLVLDTDEPVEMHPQARLLDAQPMTGLLRWLEQAAAARDAHRLLQSARPLLQACLLDAAHAPAAPARVRRAIDWLALQVWVDARLDAPLKVADLASRVHLSPTQFALRCLEEQGLSPAAWLRRRRLRRAQELRRLGWTAERAAPACGYSSASSLLTALRRTG